MKIEIEQVDEITNEIMDMIRIEFKLKEDSDKDDKVYGFIHNKIKEFRTTRQVISDILITKDKLENEVVNDGNNISDFDFREWIDMIYEELQNDD